MCRDNDRGTVCRYATGSDEHIFIVSGAPLRDGPAGQHMDEPGILPYLHISLICANPVA